MQEVDFQTVARPVPPEALTQLPAVEDEQPGDVSNTLLRESLLINLDASLRVHARPQFFSWTQGLLQNLIRHEILICALRSSKSPAFYVESFSMGVDDPARFSMMFRQDTTLVPRLIKAWEQNCLQPVLCSAEQDDDAASSPLARELGRLGATSIYTHGTYDSFGKLVSLFAFARRPEAADPGLAHTLEIIVPLLHTAWMRIQIGQRGETADFARPSGAGILTVRELEVLKWMYLGKSNIEIGTILGLSPLTVKNHVQKILRKLNVRNRTQAVGKGLALRIVNP